MDADEAYVRQLEAMESFKQIVGAPSTGVVTERNTDVGALINSRQFGPAAVCGFPTLHRVRIYVPGSRRAFTAGPSAPGLKSDVRDASVSGPESSTRPW